MKNKKVLRKLKRKEQSLYDVGNKYIKKKWGGKRGTYYVMDAFGTYECECEDAEFYFWRQSYTFVEGAISYKDGYCYAGPILPDYSDKTIKYFIDKMSKLYEQIYDLEMKEID